MSDDAIKEVHEEIQEAREEASERKPQIKAAPEAEGVVSARSNLREIFEKTQLDSQVKRPKAAAPEEAEEESEEVEESAEAPEKKQTKNTTEYRKAREALVLRGWNPKALNALDAEETLSQWSHLESRERETERAFQERAELRKKLEKMEATKGEEPRAVPTSLEDLDVSPFLKEIGFEGDEGAKTALKSIITKALDPIRMENQDLRQQLQMQAKTTLETMLDAERSRLTSSYPRLADSDQAWQAVLTVADRLVGEREGLNITKAVDAAVMEIYGEPQADNSQDRARSASRAQRAASAPTVPVKRSSAPQSMSAKQRARAIFDFVQSRPRVTPEEAKQYAEQLPPVKQARR